MAPSRIASLQRVFDAVAAVCMLVAGIALVVLIAVSGWLVYGRYVLNDTPTWVEQFALLLVVYITFLGAAAGVQHNSHLSIDFIREAFPRRPRIVMRQLTDLIVAVFGCFMTWQGWHLVMTNLERPVPMLGVSESWRALPLVISGVLIVVFSVSRVLQRLLVGVSGEEA